MTTDLPTVPPDEMLDQIAKAMYDTNFISPTWEKAEWHRKDQFRQYARAAVTGAIIVPLAEFQQLKRAQLACEEMMSEFSPRIPRSYVHFHNWVLNQPKKADR